MKQNPLVKKRLRSPEKHEKDLLKNSQSELNQAFMAGYFQTRATANASFRRIKRGFRCHLLYQENKYLNSALEMSDKFNVFALL